MRKLFSLMACILLPGILAAQDKKDAKPGDEMIQKYLNAETDKLSQKFLDGAKSIEEWKEKRPRLYQEYMDMLGLWPIPEKTPLKATKTGELEAHGVVVEMVHFQSKPGLYVTGNLYRPKDDAGAKRGKLPTILYVCGHSGKGRDGNKTAFQDHGFWFANHGYICLVIDTLQLGEIPGVHHGTYGRPWISAKSYGQGEKDKLENRFWWHSIGYSPAAVECWNGVRAIDYLVSRPDVDADKIGVTGISGGGAATFWIAAADERVKVAVPVSGMADLESYVKNKVINGHCDCMFLYNTYQWDWTTIAALVAPRPMLFANSDKDSIFPMDANRRVFAKLQKIYGMYGVEKSVGEYVSKGGHDYRPDLRKAIFHFFNMHLKRQPTPLVEDSAKYTPLEGKKLRVFPTDADLPKDSINHRVDEVFIPAAKVTLPEKGKFAEWKQMLIGDLKKRSFRTFPEKQASIDRRFKGNMALIGFHFTEEEIEVAGLYFAVGGKERSKDSKYQMFVFGEDYQIKDWNKMPKWAEPYLEQGNFGVYPRGTYDDEFTRWTRKSPPNYVERSLALTGRTLDQGRVWDVISRIQWYNKYWKRDENWQVYGYGQNGILAAYAALFEPSIKEVIVIDPPKSHKEGPHFLNVLRVLDTPEALGLLAPTPLTIIGGKDAAFDRTEEIYRLAGAADKLVRK